MPRVRPGTRLFRDRLNALVAGQHGLGWRDKPGGCYSSSAADSTEAFRALFESFGNCVLRMLAEGY